MLFYCLDLKNILGATLWGNVLNCRLAIVEVKSRFFSKFPLYSVTGIYRGTGTQPEVELLT